MQLTNLKDHELLIALCNLTKTYYACGGHNKAAHNEAKMNIVIDEMKKRCLKIPSVNNRLETGIFNGEFTY